MEAASLPRASPAVKTPIHTQHTGRHGDDGLVELLPWSWPDGSHGATTPLPGWSWGSEPGSGLKVHIALVEGQYRDAPLACTEGQGQPSTRAPADPRAPAPATADSTVDLPMGASTQGRIRTRRRDAGRVTSTDTTPSCCTSARVNQVPEHDDGAPEQQNLWFGRIAVGLSCSTSQFELIGMIWASHTRARTHTHTRTHTRTRTHAGTHTHTHTHTQPPKGA